MVGASSEGTQTEHTAYKALSLEAVPFFFKKIMLMLNISHQPFETLFRSRQTDGILLFYKGISQCLSGLGSHSVEAGLARTSKVS